MQLARAFLIAFTAALGWFAWALASETNRSCFGASHYVPSAAAALAVVVVVQAALDARSARRADDCPDATPRVEFLARGALAAALLVTAGLLAGG